MGRISNQKRHIQSRASARLRKQKNNQVSNSSANITAKDMEVLEKANENEELNPSRAKLKLEISKNIGAQV